MVYRYGVFLLERDPFNYIAVITYSRAQICVCPASPLVTHLPNAIHRLYAGACGMLAGMYE